MDAVDRLKKELCEFAQKKLGAKYVDCMSLITIVDKYNRCAGSVAGNMIDCITIHNRLLAIRYPAGEYTLDYMDRLLKTVSDTVRDNTTGVVCVPDDIAIQSMTQAEFGKFIHELLRIYQEKPDYPGNIDTTGWRWMGYDYADHMYGLRHMMEHSAAGLENQFLRQRF